MVDGMMRPLLFLTVLLYPVAVIAAGLPDPTRPPAFISAAGGGPNIAHRQSSTKYRSSGLQSTIISESRRAAIIDGRTVELWAKHGNTQLIEVNEGSVVLQGARTQRVLTMFPGVKMTQKEIKVNKTLPDNVVRPAATSTMHGAQQEELLSGHSKEKK